jgi:hypothetical protein
VSEKREYNSAKYTHSPHMHSIRATLLCTFGGRGRFWISCLSNTGTPPPLLPWLPWNLRFIFISRSFRLGVGTNGIRINEGEEYARKKKRKKQQQQTLTTHYPQSAPPTFEQPPAWRRWRTTNHRWSKWCWAQQYCSGPRTSRRTRRETVPNGYRCRRWRQRRKAVC